MTLLRHVVVTATRSASNASDLLHDLLGGASPNRTVRSTVTPTNNGSLTWSEASHSCSSRLISWSEYDDDASLQW